ncbi:MAG: LytTR family transcriptional regulator DNA-binding domain-containing protein [Crocinitomicaceae bacterium]|nr:LytTR family transcriptional regulator DNA-binding domain-containing protein [Crocinitomicaceae bacterium]
MRQVLLKYLCSILFFSTVVCSAQLSHHHKYGTSNGLSSSEVYDVFQDKNGHLWLATDYGINEYDGDKFYHYSTKDGLTDNTIFRFHEDQQGRIWCTTFNNSIFRLDPNEHQFTPFKWNDSLRALPAKWIMSNMFVDDQENFYFTFVHKHGYIKIDKQGHVDKQIHRMHEQQTEIIRCWSQSPEYALTYSCVKDSLIKIPPGLKYISVPILQESWGKYGLTEAITYQDIQTTYISYHKNITAFNHETGSITTIPLDAKTSKLRKLNEEQFWVSTRTHGTYFFDKLGNIQFRAFPRHEVTDVFIDHEKNYWVATQSDGVYHLNNLNVQNVDKDNNFVSVSDLSWDGNSLWIGYEDGRIKRISKDTTFTEVKERSYLSAYFYYDDNRDRMYYCSEEYLFNTETKDKVDLGTSLGFRVYETVNGDSIVNWYQSGIYLCLPPDGKKSRISNNMRVTCNANYHGTSYFGTIAGLSKVQNGDLVPADKKHNELNNRIDALTVFKDYLVAGSRGKGIFCYNEKDVLQLTTSNGLSSNFISNFYVENDSTLWVCTNAGLDRLLFSQNKFKVQSLSVDDGLKSNEITDIEIVGDKIWVGTRDGVCRIFKSAFEREQKQINYFPKIDKIEVNDAQFDWKDARELAYDQNRLSFEFSAVSFLEAQELKFRYRLKGLEDRWNYTFNNDVVYTELSPGNYEFIMQVKGENDSWTSGEQRFAFTIYSPYWSTWWFITLIVISVALIIYLFFRYRVLIYNADILREILRQIMKRLRNDKQYLTISEAGKEIKIDTSTICYVKADGNYIEIVTTDQKHIVREKIGNFLDLVPDPLEFIRVKRSFIIRIDKIQEKGKKYVIVNDLKIDVGNTYLKELDKIVL